MFRASNVERILRTSCLHHAGGIPCPGCSGTRFCSTVCAAAAAADPASHNALVCGSLGACNWAGLGDEQRSSLHFLLRAYSLQLAALAGDALAGARFAALLSLVGEGEGAGTGVQELHGRLCHALAAAGVAGALPQVQQTANLLRKDELCGYGIMAPSDAEVGCTHPPASHGHC